MSQYRVTIPGPITVLAPNGKPVQTLLEDVPENEKTYGPMQPNGTKNQTGPIGDDKPWTMARFLERWIWQDSKSPFYAKKHGAGKTDSWRAQQRILDALEKGEPTITVRDTDRARVISVVEGWMGWEEDSRDKTEQFPEFMMRQLLPLMDAWIEAEKLEE